MNKLNKAIKHYYNEGYFTKELLLGVENEVPGSLSNNIVLSAMDNRDVVDDKLYKQLLDVQLGEMKKELEEDKKDETE